MLDKSTLILSQGGAGLTLQLGLCKWLLHLTNGGFQPEDTESRAAVGEVPGTFIGLSDFGLMNSEVPKGKDSQGELIVILP